MRIGLFTDTYPPFINGVSTSVSMLKDALEKKGHTVYIVTVNTDNLKYMEDKENHLLRIPSVPVGIYDYRLSGVYPVKATKIIKKWNLDVIHSHTEFGIGTFARIIAKQFNIPLIHTYHTMYEDYVHYITKGYFKKSSKKIVEYLTLFYCDKTANELIVPTKKTYDLFKQKYDVDRNIYIIPSGIDVERFYHENTDLVEINRIKREYQLLKDDFVVLFVGRIASEKNIEFLIDNHKSILKRIPTCKLLIVGDGPDAPLYKKKVSKLGLDDSIIFTGKVSWDKVPCYYQVADVFVTASTTETQGLTVVEAMAAGVSPVCIDDESFRNTVVDGLNGYLFHNKKEYQRAVIDLYNNPDKLKQMSKQARINSERYSAKYYAEGVLDVYNHAIFNKKSKYGFLDKIFDVFRRK